MAEIRSSAHGHYISLVVITNENREAKRMISWTFWLCDCVVIGFISTCEVPSNRLVKFEVRIIPTPVIVCLVEFTIFILDFRGIYILEKNLQN